MLGGGLEESEDDARGRIFEIRTGHRRSCCHRGRCYLRSVVLGRFGRSGSGLPLLESLITRTIRDGDSAESGALARALDMWIAEELRAAGFAEGECGPACASRRCLIQVWGSSSKSCRKSLRNNAETISAEEDPPRRAFRAPCTKSRSTSECPRGSQVQRFLFRRKR